MKVTGIRQHAEAIYDLAVEENKLSDYLELSIAIINVFNEESNLNKYLSSSSVTIEEKQALISDIADGNEFYKNWLLILVEQGKAKHIRSYVEGFIKYYNKQNGITEGIIWSTEVLSQEEIHKLEEASSSKVDKKVSLLNKIDKELIGGIKLEIEDNVWDNTIKNKLVNLLKEGEE